MCVRTVFGSGSGENGIEGLIDEVAATKVDWRQRYNRDIMDMTSKQEALKIIHALPDDVTMAQIRDSLDFRAKVDEGLAAIERGDVVSHDEALKVLRKWRLE